MRERSGLQIARGKIPSVGAGERTCKKGDDRGYCPRATSPCAVDDEAPLRERMQRGGCGSLEAVGPEGVDQQDDDVFRARVVRCIPKEWAILIAPRVVTEPVVSVAATTGSAGWDGAWEEQQGQEPRTNGTEPFRLLPGARGSLCAHSVRYALVFRGTKGRAGLPDVFRYWNAMKEHQTRHLGEGHLTVPNVRERKQIGL